MTSVLKRFLAQDSAGGIFLVVAAIAAMIMANTGLSDLYATILNTQIQLRISDIDMDKTLADWVNDGFMAIFFLLIGLEVKRELVSGALSSRDKAMFPALAAVGGMLFPALWYLVFNHTDSVTQHGWAIPAATDIAFALGVMALLGKRVPLTLKVFLLALAIIDDLGAIVIIALFYNDGLSMTALGMAVIGVLVLFWLNRSQVQSLVPYLIIGWIVWFTVLQSGIHATLAGVILGFLIPLYGRKFSPSRAMEEFLNPWCAFFILPVFAFVNAGVPLAGLSLADITSSVPLGIITGLLLGKPMGIFLICWLVVRFNIAKLPEGVCFKQVFAVSMLCGIGFTMSIFISSLAFEGYDNYADLSRLGILLGSTLAAVIGYVMLYVILPKEAVRTEEMRV